MIPPSCCKVSGMTVDWGKIGKRKELNQQAPAADLSFAGTDVTGTPPISGVFSQGVPSLATRS